MGITSFGISTVSGYVGTFVTTTDASMRKSRSITNALGQLIRVDEPTGISANADADLGAIGTPNQPTVYKYSPQGKMVQVTQGFQNRYFLYDSLGRLIRVRQPEQEINTSLNLSDPVTSNSNWTAGFSYDVLGNVITATDAKGTVITNAYDKASRVTTSTYSNEPQGITTPAVNFYYDGKGLAAPQTPNFAKGKQTKVTNSISETQNTLFDNFGRLTETKQITDGNTYTSKYTYNLSGALVEEEYPSGRKVKNEFESDGDLSKVTSAKTVNSVYSPYVSNFSYSASGGISQMKLGNGKWETAKFNNRLQVTELGLGASSVDAGTWKVAYEYGELQTNGTVDTAKNTGNIAKQTLSFNGLAQPFVQAYKYDSLYRLTEAKETPSGSSTANWIQNWTYDLYGNRLTFTQNIAGNTVATNPAVDQNTNRFVTTGTNFQYDFNGDNKQTQVKDVNNSIIGTYFYDGEGKRVKKVTSAETTVFVYSSGKLIAEYSTVALPSNPTTSYTTTDHLGSPRVITDALGSVLSRRDFMPFGEELTVNIGARSTALKYGSADNIRQKFTGYQKDTETSLDFAETRMYENRYGRFTAVDPLLASGKSINPQTFNRYVYVGNNPVILRDPLGLEWYFNQSRNRYEWSSDNKNLANGEVIDGNWKLVTDHVYWAGEETGFVVLDPKQRDWTTGFDSREDAVQFLDPGQNVSLADGVDEMMTAFDVVTGIGGVIRRGGKIAITEGGEFAAERLIKKASSELLREAAEKELRAAGKEVTTLALNKMVGLAAERIVEKQLVEEGFEVLGSQVTAKLANGEIRYIDRLVKSPTGEILGVEVKSGGSPYTRFQEAKDGLIESSGAVLGNNAPATLQGQTMKFRTVVRRIE